MAASHLKSYAIGWACPRTDHDVFGSERGLNRGQAVIEVNKAVQAFVPLTTAINTKLKAQATQTQPAIQSAMTVLSAFEGDWISIAPVEIGKPPALHALFSFDPLRLLDLANDNAGLGKLATDIVSDLIEAVRFAERAKFVTGFPYALFEAATTEFEQADYKTSWTSKSLKPLEGTPLKVRYRVDASMVATKVSLILVKGRTEVWERQVRVLRAGLIDNTETFTTREDDRLRVHGLLPESV